MAHVYFMTVKTKDEAEKIVNCLLEKRLIAGANMVPAESRYWWKGEICNQTEYLVFMQSRAQRFSEIETTVKELHSYEIPCILTLNIDRGNADFLSWIYFNTTRG